MLDDAAWQDLRIKDLDGCAVPLRSERNPPVGLRAFEYGLYHGEQSPNGSYIKCGLSVHLPD